MLCWFDPGREGPPNCTKLTQRNKLPACTLLCSLAADMKVVHCDLATFLSDASKQSRAQVGSGCGAVWTTAGSCHNRRLTVILLSAPAASPHQASGAGTGKHSASLSAVTCILLILLCLLFVV